MPSPRDGLELHLQTTLFDTHDEIDWPDSIRIVSVARKISEHELQTMDMPTALHLHYLLMQRELDAEVESETKKRADA